MCTSFLYRGNDTVIGMNYDNYGNNLEVAPYDKKLFLVTAKLAGEVHPLLGVRSDGVFINQQFVSPCEGGRFRTGEGIMSTLDLVEHVLLDRPPKEEIASLLRRHRFVSLPDFMLPVEAVGMPKFQIHTLLADVGGDSTIIEPGRGKLEFDKEQKTVVMSNCSLWEARETGEYQGFGVDRQLVVEERLEKAGESFSVADAFAVLKAAELVEYQGFCSTELSLVYTAKENAVYYCYQREFDQIHRYQMED